MTETASFTQVQVAHVDKEAARSTTTTTGGLQGKTQAPISLSRGPSLNLHSHRQNNNASKLPSFRLTDIKPSPSTAGSSIPAPLQSPPLQKPVQYRRLSRSSSSSALPILLSEDSPILSLDTVILQGDRESPTATATAATTATTTTTKPKITAAPTTPKPILTRATTAPVPPITPRRLADKQSIEQLDSTTPQRSLRTRASSYQTRTESPIAEERSRVVRRLASVPDSLVEEAQSFPSAQSPQSPLSRAPSVKKPNRRPPASYSSNGVATSGGPPPSLSTQRRQVVEPTSAASKPSVEAPTPQKQYQEQHGESVSAKTLSQRNPPDEHLAQSSHKPTVPPKPPVNQADADADAEPQPQTPARRRIPPPTPKRSSRLVNHRKSVAIDMNFTSRTYNFGEGNPPDTNFVPIFRGVDTGRHGSDLPSTPISSPRQPVLSNDDTGDVFLKIASEENTRRADGGDIQDSVLGKSQIRGSSANRRPLSTAISSFGLTSPPRLSRRISDHQDGVRFSSRYKDDVLTEVARSAAYRQLIGKTSSVHPAEENPIVRFGASLRPSPIAPRPPSIADRGPDKPAYKRRRPSLTESHPAGAALTSPILVHSREKTEISSPLARVIGTPSQSTPDVLHTIEGTESTGSTTGPSTVWDELDDLKSRIHRLELTGKLPPTSGAAVMKGGEDRPTTATTTMTTMSISPKKSVTGLQQAEVASNASSHRETNAHHPNLHSALAKTKSILSPEVFRALASAANDALALSAVMGAPGQPGPICSATGPAGSSPMLTDRQLRRRADGVCRSLTELCIALNESSSRAVPALPIQTNAAAPKEVPLTPSVVTKTYSGMASRRASMVPEQIAQVTLSPRAVSKFEERRNVILNNGVLSSPRNVASTPATPNDAAIGRRTSLVVTRNRRTGTEEVEDGRRSTLLLRSRRTGTEDVEEGRKTAFLVRGRRGTMEESEEARFRAPSRATTEVTGTRPIAREYIAEAPTSRWDDSAQGPTVLGRRRFIPSNLHVSRTVVPASSTATPMRKYIERTYTLPEAAEDVGGGDKAVDRVSRHLSFTQSTIQNRTNHVSSHTSGRRMANRDSVVVPASSARAADGYR